MGEASLILEGEELYSSLFGFLYSVSCQVLKAYLCWS